jgi:hypothetical protein
MATISFLPVYWILVTIIGALTSAFHPILALCQGFRKVESMAFSRKMDVTARSVLCDEEVSSRAIVGDCFGKNRLAMTPGRDFEKAIRSKARTLTN